MFTTHSIAVHCPEGARWDGSHAVILGNAVVNVVGTHDGRETALTFLVHPGYTCDGLSVPRPFRWFLKAWDEENPAYSFAGVCHDLLYSERGCGRLSREDCDSLFRGALRESGIGRFRAGVADKAVEWFAGGKRHWGHVEPGNVGKYSIYFF